jgi:hypothetical protein
VGAMAPEVGAMALGALNHAGGGARFGVASTGGQ